MPEYTVALGTFDGLHIGHKAVLDNILGENSKPIALTFKTPPKMTESLGLLMMPHEKNRLLEKQGIMPVVLDFESVKDLSPKEFLEYILSEYNPKKIATGFNFRFGKSAVGGVKDLKEFCQKNKIQYMLTEAVNFENQPVSSTRIRQCIAKGDITSANKMLGRPFSFSGKVIHGDERGREMGFPTINQIYPDILTKVRFGVYASITQIGNKFFTSVTNVGIRPTFETEYVTSETNIIDFSGNLYDENIKIHLLEFIRPEVKFNGLASLKDRIEADKNIAIEIFEKIGYNKDIIMQKFDSALN